MLNSASVDLNPFALRFEQYVFNNLQYWSGYVSKHTADLPHLETRRDGIIKALNFGLGVDGLWTSLYRLLSDCTPLIEKRGHWQTWLNVLEPAILVAQRSGHPADAASLSLFAARLRQWRGDFGPAIHHFRTTIHLAQTVGDQVTAARAQSNLGFLFTEQGNWWRAETLCCRALAEFEEEGFDHGLAHTENHLGFLYTRLHRWQAAERHLQRACAIWQGMGDDHGLMRGYINLGVLFIKREYGNQAITYLEKALQQAKATGEMIEIGKIYLNLGVAHSLEGNLDQAERLARQAEQIFKQHFSIMELAFAYNTLGSIGVEQENWAAAKKHHISARQIWQRLGNKREEAKTRLLQTKLSIAKGDTGFAQEQLENAESFIRQQGLLANDPYLQTLLAQCREALPAR